MRNPDLERNLLSERFLGSLPNKGRPFQGVLVKFLGEDGRLESLDRAFKAASVFSLLRGLCCIFAFALDAVFNANQIEHPSSPFLTRVYLRASLCANFHHFGTTKD